MSIYTNSEEKQKFGNLADGWWDRNGPVRTLHDINPVRLDYIMRKSPLAGKKVADIGCGGGILSESLAINGALVTGIDTSQELIKVAQSHSEKSNVEIDYMPVDTPTLVEISSDQFDIVVCMELIEHVDDVHSLIGDCSKLLKKGGQLFLSTINRSFTAYFLGILAAERLLKIVPEGTHDFNRFIKPSELSICCRAFNLENTDVKGLAYNPFTRKAAISRRIYINYISSFLAR